MLERDQNCEARKSLERRIRSKTRRIALLSPYTGSNLGDGAILHALVQNIRVKLPEADFVLFDLDPERTSLLHRLPALPITGLIVDNYSNPLKEALGIGGDFETSEATATRRFWHRIKHNKLARRLFRRAWVIAKTVYNLPSNVVREIGHLRWMYGLLQEFQLVIVAGGGQIDDYWGGAFGHPYTLWKWSLLSKLTGVDFIVLSTGMDSLRSWLSVLLTKQMLQKAPYRSYRDEGSKELLANHSINLSSHVVPDLAFSFPLEEIPVQRRVVAPKTVLHVGLSPIAYMHPEHWPRKDAGVYRKYEEALASFACWLLNSGHNVTLFATDAPDYQVIESLCKRPDLRLSSRTRERLNKVNVRTAQELLSELVAFDVVVASRLHGVILSHLCGNPTVAISYERKVVQHMLEMGQEDLCVDIHGVETALLTKAFVTCITDRFVRMQEIGARVGVKRGELDSQYNLVIQMLNT